MYKSFKEHFSYERIGELETILNSHSVYQNVRTFKDLDIFMKHHIFSVWDFMSLLKYLQSQIAPSSYPWVPANRFTNSRRFVNAIVLEEESDQNGSGGKFTSHYEMYLNAMSELDIKANCIKKFTEIVTSSGLDRALEQDCIPGAAKKFVASTFSFIRTGKPHIAAAAFAFGREKIIPDMFRQFIEHSGMKRTDAPSFHYYLERHIHLDEDYHAPLSMKMLEELCDGDGIKIQEAQLAAENAIESRILFWDGVQQSLSSYIPK